MGLTTWLLIVFGGISLVLLSIVIARLQRRPFDPDRWQADARLRPILVHDLARSQRLLGLRRKAVLALLGEPDYASGCSLAYCLFGNPDGDKLRIRLDSADSVFKVKIERGCTDVGVFY
ncbi:MAG: hypothetical protein ACKV0T_03175 [Planctomycetales bacterium]